MLKISDLQSQIALNRKTLEQLEEKLYYQKYAIRNLDLRSFRNVVYKEEFVLQTKNHIQYYKKKIKQYAKLQRALKDEIAYRIRYDRAMISLEDAIASAKEQDFIIDNSFDKEF